MKKNPFARPAYFILSILALFAGACGARFSGTYNLTQTLSNQGYGGYYSPYGQQQNCSMITLSVNESSNQISGMGQNQCYQEQLTGTNSGSGQAQVTLNIISVQGGYSSSQCTYQGILSISGNSVSGMLTLMNNGQNANVSGCSPSVTLSGTKS